LIRKSLQLEIFVQTTWCRYLTSDPGTPYNELLNEILNGFFEKWDLPKEMDFNEVIGFSYRLLHTNELNQESH